MLAIVVETVQAVCGLGVEPDGDLFDAGLSSLTVHACMQCTQALHCGPMTATADPGLRLRTLEVRTWTADPGPMTADPWRCGPWTLDPGLRTLEVRTLEMRTLEVRLRTPTVGVIWPSHSPVLRPPMRPIGRGSCSKA